MTHWDLADLKSQVLPSHPFPTIELSLAPYQHKISHLALDKKPPGASKALSSVCKALCPCGCSFRSREQRPGSPGPAPGQSRALRAVPRQRSPRCRGEQERVRGAGTCGAPAASRCQPEQVCKGLGSACISRSRPHAGRRVAGRTRGAPLDRGTRPSAQINHIALNERSRSPPRHAAICLCCSPAPARCGGAGAGAEEGARSPVALPSQQGGGETFCGTGCREGPARRPYLPTCGARPGRVARRLCCACPPGSAEPRVGSGPAPRRPPLAGPA